MFTDPLPPSCNRDKLQFSGGELINTLWPSLIFSVKSSTLLHDIENLHYVRPQKMLQIVWKQKHQREHGTCDKKILTPPSIRICPLFDELKKGDFLPPSLLFGPMSPSQHFFFLKASLTQSMFRSIDGWIWPWLVWSFVFYSATAKIHFNFNRKIT